MGTWPPCNKIIPTFQIVTPLTLVLWFSGSDWDGGSDPYFFPDYNVFIVRIFKYTMDCFPEEAASVARLNRRKLQEARGSRYNPPPARFSMFQRWKTEERRQC